MEYFGMMPLSGLERFEPDGFHEEGFEDGRKHRQQMYPPPPRTHVTGGPE